MDQEDRKPENWCPLLAWVGSQVQIETGGFGEEEPGRMLHFCPDRAGVSPCKTHTRTRTLTHPATAELGRVEGGPGRNLPWGRWDWGPSNLSLVGELG